MTKHQVWTDDRRIAYEQGLLKWHRDELCDQLFVTDIDLILGVPNNSLHTIEYDLCKTVAYIDYKTHSRWEIDTAVATQWRGATALGTGMFVVEAYSYHDDREFQVWKIHPNAPFTGPVPPVLWPRDLHREDVGYFDATQFETWLHNLHGLTCCRARLS
jgi:hypothetical protein